LPTPAPAACLFEPTSFCHTLRVRTRIRQGRFGGLSLKEGAILEDSTGRGGQF
jgi:hypothetical protein